jgi:cytochrome c-type biogenesis protein CcmH/NrfG
MKKETAILAILIALIVGFIAGALSYWRYSVGRKAGERPAVAQQPQAPPQTASQEPPLAEVTAKIDALRDIVKKDPNNIAAWMELGNLYFDSDRPREAIEAYGKYLAVKPDNADVRTDMGIMYRKLGDSDRALQEFRKAAQNDAKHVNSRYNIGVVLLHDKQDIKGAIKAWEDYLKVDSNSERAVRVKAQMERMRAMVK